MMPYFQDPTYDWSPFSLSAPPDGAIVDPIYPLIRSVRVCSCFGPAHIPPHHITYPILRQIMCVCDACIITHVWRVAYVPACCGTGSNPQFVCIILCHTICLTFIALRFHIPTYDKLTTHFCVCPPPHPQVRLPHRTPGPHTFWRCQLSSSRYCRVPGGPNRPDRGFGGYNRPLGRSSPHTCHSVGPAAAGGGLFAAGGGCTRMDPGGCSSHWHHGEHTS